MRDFLWVVNWKIFCKMKREDGLVVRRLVKINQAVRLKLNRRYAMKEHALWRSKIAEKYGAEQGDWTGEEVRGAYGVSVWKTIKKEWEVMRNFHSLESKEWSKE